MGAFAYCPKCEQGLDPPSLAEAFERERTCPACGYLCPVSTTFADALNDHQTWVSEQILSLHQRLDGVHQRLDSPRQVPAPDLAGLIALLEDLEKTNGPEILNQLLGVAFLRYCEVNEDLTAFEWLAAIEYSKGFDEVTKRG